MKVLLVEDNPAFAELVREVLLEVPGETFEITSAGNLSSASALLAAEEIGAVLLDLGLPDSQGIETVRTVRAAYPGVPIVVLTGLDDEETGLRALHEGAQDYLTKDSLAGPSLARSIRYALERSGVRKELIRKNAELEAAYGVLAAHEEELRRSVSELSRAEGRLRESAHLLMKAQEIAHLGSWEYTPANNRVVWSDEVYRILSLPLHEPAVDYGEFLELVHADDRCAVDAAYRGSLEEAGSGYEVEFRVVRESDGEVRHVHERCEHFRDETGAVLRSVGMIHDITERRRAAEALEEYAGILKGSNEDLERFAYVCSHDLQEPLRSVVSFSQLLERRYRGKLDADADEYIGFIVEGGNRMQALIRDLLEFSRVTTRGTTIRPTDSGATLVEVLRDMQTAIGETGASVECGPLPMVMADPTRLGQVFANLIGNAIKYRRTGVPPEIEVSAYRVGPMVEFAVQDNGIGIEEEYFGRIFDMFRRLHTHDQYEGTGIGLALVRKIVEQHGGRVRVESEPGVGSTFRFTMKPV